MKNWLDELLANLPPALEEPPEGDPKRWRFDPDQDSVADVIDALEIDCREQAEDWGEETETREFYEWKADGLAWLRIALGLDFSDLQARLQQVPVIHVPEHLSDKYDLNEQRRLFGCLDQIRSAYVVGADLAAIALCRSITEFLIRYHYASHVPNAEVSSGKGRTTLSGTNPPGLIEQAENQYDFLKDFDLGEKMDKANKILHQPIAEEINEGVGSTQQRLRYPFRALVVGWLNVLEKMISRVP
jgi:hypothetical protein